MRPLVFALAATLATGAPRVTSDERPEIQAARPIHVVYERATLEGTCTLVDVEPHAAGRRALLHHVGATLQGRSRGAVRARDSRSESRWMTGPR